ncbi:MAG: hypothetical protein AMS18_01905 [Gemmatimonas sp. SG8_17]|nr:MAG: hypothetical protein AMS18_01905 [Gemmatimonas sp. SG8_17]
MTFATAEGQGEAVWCREERGCHMTAYATMVWLGFWIGLTLASMAAALVAVDWASFYLGRQRPRSSQRCRSPLF